MLVNYGELWWTDGIHQLFQQFPSALKLCLGNCHGTRAPTPTPTCWVEPLWLPWYPRICRKPGPSLWFNACESSANPLAMGPVNWSVVDGVLYPAELFRYKKTILLWKVSPLAPVDAILFIMSVGLSPIISDEPLPRLNVILLTATIQPIFNIFTKHHEPQPLLSMSIITVHALFISTNHDQRIHHHHHSNYDKRCKVEPPLSFQTIIVYHGLS